MSLEYVALGKMMFVGIVFFYGIIAIHDIPYENEIAKKRRHPHHKQSCHVLLFGPTLRSALKRKTQTRARPSHRCRTTQWGQASGTVALKYVF